MATTKKTAGTTRTKTTIAKAEPEITTETVASETTVSERRKKLTLADVPLTELVEVQSCFYGNLIYVSKKTGYRIEWNEFGATQYVSVEDLLAMRNSQPAFFVNQWVRLIGDNASDVINFLQLEKYYSKTAGFDSFDDIFKLTPAKIEDVVSTFTDSMKESFARYTYSVLSEGELDLTIKKIEAIEKATGFEIRE